MQYDVRLSDLYLSVAGIYGTDAPSPDLETTVHVYDFRMCMDGVLEYIEDGVLPGRFMAYDNSMGNYVMVANRITYMQRVLRDGKCRKPKNIVWNTWHYHQQMNR